MPKNNPDKYDDLLRRALERQRRGKGGKRTQARIDAAVRGGQGQAPLRGQGKMLTPPNTAPKQKGSGTVKTGLPANSPLLMRQAAPPRRKRRVNEDEPGWDPATMGNRRSGGRRTRDGYIVG